MVRQDRRGIFVPLCPSRHFRVELAELDIWQSAIRTGSRFDNADAETFFAVLKSEIGTTAWQTPAQARQDAFGWIAQYYNREWLHSTIAASPRIRREAATDDPTSRHKTEVSDLKGSLQEPHATLSKVQRPSPTPMPKLL